MPFALSSFVVMVFPYGLFALAAVVLWRRRRTPATSLMALGFVATLVGEVTASPQPHRTAADALRDTSGAVDSRHGHGMARRKSLTLASSNTRWSGP